MPNAVTGKPSAADRCASAWSMDRRAMKGAWARHDCRQSPTCHRVFTGRVEGDFSASVPASVAEVDARSTPDKPCCRRHRRAMLWPAADFSKSASTRLSSQEIQRALLMLVPSNTASTPYSFNKRLATTSNCSTPTAPSVRGRRCSPAFGRPAPRPLRPTAANPCAIA